MRRVFLPVLAAAFVPALLAFAADPPKDAPKPPTTPLPAFENPMWDAKPGETLFYRVRELEGKWTRYYEERVLARVKDQVLIETILTDETGTKDFGRDPDPRNTGWREVTQDMKVGTIQKWVKERQKDEVVVIGDPPRAAVRCTRRVIDEPEDFSRPDGKRRHREIWYSHDVPCSGRVKMFPAQQNGERLAISWDKKLPADVCEKRAALIPMPEKKEEPAMAEPGMEEPGMGEPAMGEPGKEEPGMGEPGMDEPAMDEPKDGK